MAIDYISFAYAASIIVGGIVGFVKEGSPKFLFYTSVMGGGFSCYGAYEVSLDPNDYCLIYGLSACTGGMMGALFYNSREFIPKGLLAVLSCLMVIRFTIRTIIICYKEATRDSVTSETRNDV